MTHPNPINPDYQETWYVWQNDFGTIDIATSEHGHYASVCLGAFDTRQEAEEFVHNLPADEAGIADSDEVC